MILIILVMKDVATCNTSGTFTAQNCKSCVSGYTYYSNSKIYMNNNEKEGKYEENGDLKDCYHTCKKCSAGGTDSSHNCDERKDGHHFNRTTKNCINTQPDRTYLDNSDKIYKDYYSKCQSCIPKQELMMFIIGIHVFQK